MIELYVMGLVAAAAVGAVVYKLIIEPVYKKRFKKQVYIGELAAKYYQDAALEVDPQTGAVSTLKPAYKASVFLPGKTDVLEVVVSRPMHRVLTVGGPVVIEQVGSGPGATIKVAADVV